MSLLPITISITCGLPGSGKSTFINHLHEYYSSFELKKTNLFSIDFDRLYSNHFEKNIINDNNELITMKSDFNHSNWNVTRQLAFCQVENLKNLLMNSIEKAKENNNDNNIHFNNDLNLIFENQLNQIIDFSFENDEFKILTNLKSCFKTTKNSKINFKNENFLIIIDDNMYYKSMRKKYFNLAKQSKSEKIKIYFLP